MNDRKEKLIKRCPVCKGINIKQDMDEEQFTMHTVIGSLPKTWKDGSHCEDCGVKFVFNVKKGG